MASPFIDVACTIRYDNARVLTWSLKPDGNYPDNFIIQVENSRAGGPWEILDADVKEYCAFVDNRKRNYNKKMNECYRLRMVVPDTQEEYVSEVVNAGNYLAYPFSSEAENVIKQVEKAIELSGCTGVLLKRKHWGRRCPFCTDFDDQQTVNEHCPACLGTGYAGGYYNGISMSVIKDKIETSEQQGEDTIEESEIVTGRCIAYPWVRYGDVWCEDNTNKRYFIDKVVPAASYKQTTLVYQFSMHRLEYTDVLHSPMADDKVSIKDLYDAASVSYSPGDVEMMEQGSLMGWQMELDNM